MIFNYQEILNYKVEFTYQIIIIIIYLSFKKLKLRYNYFKSAWNALFESWLVLVEIF